MLERLKLVLMLPLSRKVVVGLAAGGLAFANRKWGLGLDDSSIHMLIGVAAFIVLGISIEDAANAHAAGQIEVAQTLVTKDTDRAYDDGHAAGLALAESQKETPK